MIAFLFFRGGGFVSSLFGFFDTTTTLLKGKWDTRLFGSAMMG